MTPEKFCSLWISAFGWGLSEATGLMEWCKLVDWQNAAKTDRNVLRNDTYIERTLKDFSRRFNEAKSEGSTNYRNIVPTVEEFRKLYFALIPQFKAEDLARSCAKSDGKVCDFCGGEGIVWGLAPARGREWEAPEHAMEVDPALAYYGVVAYDCPVCRAAAYANFPQILARVKRNCLPERIPVGDRNNPHNYPECGARVILAVLEARIRQATGYKEPPRNEAFHAELMKLINGNGRKRAGNVPQIAKGGEVVQADAKTHKSAGRLVSDDLAAQFGPM